MLRTKVFTVVNSLACMIPITTNREELTHVTDCMVGATIMAMIMVADTTVAGMSSVAGGPGEGRGAVVGIVRHGMVMAEASTTEDTALLGKGAR